MTNGTCKFQDISQLTVESIGDVLMLSRESGIGTRTRNLFSYSISGERGQPNLEISGEQAFNFNSATGLYSNFLSYQRTGPSATAITSGPGFKSTPQRITDPAFMASFEGTLLKHLGVECADDKGSVIEPADVPFSRDMIERMARGQAVNVTTDR